MRSLVLVTDGKPGHLNQLRGLADAIGRLTETVAEEWFVGDKRWKPSSPVAPVFISAGRKTHWPALRLARSTGGQTVVLMRPSLPSRLFDICVIPQHDGVRGANVVQTVGALNRLKPPASDRDRAGGLLLIGGPSKHHRWDDERVFTQVEALTSVRDDWTVTTSRRTPLSAVERLRRTLDSSATFLSADETPDGWVADTLLRSERAAVTEDSVSMVSEAVTAGCRTSVLSMPRLRNSRVCQAVDGFHAAGLVCDPSELQTFRPAAVLNEADRVAGEVLNRLQSRGARSLAAA